MKNPDARLRVAAFTVCQLIDGLGSSIPAATDIRPIDLDFRIGKPPLTVEWLAETTSILHHALHLAESGDVWIVAGSPNCDGAWQ